MLEQQLVDYIKKAKAAGQSDEQTRALLYKNGWSEAEVSEAYASLSQPHAQSQVRPQPQPQQPQAQVAARPEARPGPQAARQPQPSYQPQPSVATEAKMPRERKSHRGIKILIVLIILIILVGAGYFIAASYLNLPWNLFRPNPKTVVSKMLESMKNVKSSQTKTEVEIAVTDSNNAPQGNLSFSLLGGSDTTDANNPKADFTIAFDFTIPNSTTTKTDISADAEVIVLGDVLYFKLNNSSIPTSYSLPSVDISQITGKWFKLDQESMAALAKVGGEEVPDISQVNNSALQQKFRNLVSADIFSDYKQLSDQVVSGQDTYHYSATITKDKLEDLVNKIMSAAMQQAATSQTSQNNTATGPGSLVTNMVQAFVKTFVDAMGDTNIEMWIGKKDNLLYQAKVAKSIDLSKAFPGANFKIAVSFSTTNSDFNKPIIVQEPGSSQKIEEVLLPLMKVQKVSSDINQIGLIAQILFSANNTYSSLCNRGLLNGYLAAYGPTLVELNNDIVSQGAKKPVCFGAASGFCVSTQLADGSYVCIDEQGALGTTRCLASTTVCK